MTKKYIVIYTDYGDSCDGYARVLGTYESKEKAKYKMDNDIKFYQRKNDCPVTTNRGDVVMLGDEQSGCLWQLLEMEGNSDWRDIKEMTLEEVIDEFSELLLDHLPDNDNNERVENLYKRIEKDADIEIDTNDFTATIEILTTDEKEYNLLTNFISGNFLYWWRQCNWCGFPDFSEEFIFNNNQYLIQRKCATFSLKDMQEELTDEVLQKVFKGHSIVSFEYLLANPRKDVIEWALKHKDELGLNKIKPEFIEEHQAIPELKEMILNNLYEKEGIK